MATESETAVFQFKEGLNPWMASQLASAEANALLMFRAMNQQPPPVSVQWLADMTLSVEANKALIRDKGGPQTISREKTLEGGR